ncbi:hypothetical protein SAMN05216420_10612 [Nitrosospira sp. Nl5]|nr:hypothetical protein SAMN05216420_10612 [Nitrosospira sp. Nl5]
MLGKVLLDGLIDHVVTRVVHARCKRLDLTDNFLAGARMEIGSAGSIFFFNKRICNLS